MNLLAKAKRKTALCTRADDIGSLVKWLIPNDEIKITDRKKLGMKTFYITRDNLYVEAKDLVIERDNDFYYSNYSTKKLSRTNLTLSGSMGIGSTIENKEEPLLAGWDFLQLFAESNTGETVLVPANSIVAGEREMATSVLGDAAYPHNLPGPIPSPSDNPNDKKYNSNEANNTEITSIITSSDSTYNQLFKGVTVGSILDGSLWGTIGQNLLGWGLKKLNYVVGFDISATLSNLFRNYGLNFNTGAFGNLSNTLGASLTTDASKNSRTGLRSGDDPAFDEYFRYKGSNGNFIIHRFAEFTWEQPTTYMTPELGAFLDRNPSEVKIFKSMWDRNDDELETALKGVRAEFNLDIDRNTIVKKFNRYRVPTPDNELIGTRSHIFFTQPDMNFNFETYIRMNPEEGKTVHAKYNSRIGDLGMKLEQCHPVLLKYLSGGSRYDGHGLIPIFTHCCTGFDISDDVLETTEHGETFMGWKQTYATSNIRSKTAGTMNIKFTDDDMLSIFKMIKLWVEYMNAAWHGEVDPKAIHKDRHELDYAIAIYYFVTKHDDTELAFWSKFTGCFPTSIPSSTFSDSIGQRLTRPEYSINWAFSRKEDYRPYHLAEFNNLISNNGSDTNWDYLPTYNPETTHITRSFTGAPFIEAFDNGYFFKLRFKKP